MCSVLTDSAWIPVRNDVHLSGKLPFILWAEETYTNLTYFTYLHTTKLRPLISCSKNLNTNLNTSWAAPANGIFPNQVMYFPVTERYKI